MGIPLLPREQVQSMHCSNLQCPLQHFKLVRSTEKITRTVFWNTHIIIYSEGFCACVNQRPHLRTLFGLKSRQRSSGRRCLINTMPIYCAELLHIVQIHDVYTSMTILKDHKRIFYIQAIAKIRYAVIRCSPYNPDLVSYDFYLFERIIHSLQEIRL